MMDKILRWCHEQSLIAPGMHIVCAVSGGADSVAMLHVLYSLRDALGITLSAAHYNHHLRGAESTGKLTFRKDIDHDIEGRDVLILEDIIDSGSTLKMIIELFQKRNPKSIRICTLLDKPSGRKVDLSPDYTCFTIPAAFVVGYGLDYDDYYRNLPFVGVLKPSVYQD